MPQPADKELVPPVVASAWRELTPQYTVREIFSSKREEVRAKAAAIITQKLGDDGIVVEEVMLSDIQLPEEYAKGLEGLLLKEQEDDQTGRADGHPAEAGEDCRACRPRPRRRRR